MDTVTVDHFPNLNKKQVGHLLGELLAVIHRDGGHHVTDVGVEQACKDAETKVYSWINDDEKKRLQSHIDELEEVLGDIIGDEVVSCSNDERARKLLKW